MKVVILAGGLGSRLSEETELKPKPMVEIGGHPIIWHIMKIYSAYGLSEFIICLGYKGYVIKEFFANYFLHTSDVTFDIANNRMEVHHRAGEPWRVSLVDTGLNSQTGGRLLRVASYLEQEEDFCFTYGDGVADINIRELIAFHKAHGKAATVTAVQPPGRFGALVIQDEAVRRFAEKPKGDGEWVSGGFFVLSRNTLKYIDGENSVWELDPLQRLARDDQLRAYLHRGFWHPMDNLRDRNALEDMWRSGTPPWKVW